MSKTKNGNFHSKSNRKKKNGKLQNEKYENSLKIISSNQYQWNIFHEREKQKENFCKIFIFTVEVFIAFGSFYEKHLRN